ncbi:MAG: glutaredoxin family protein [Tuberibacillus sp.]
MKVILYSRPQCHLCIEAKEMLDIICPSLGMTYKEIDIYSNDALLEKYQLMIPVVEVDGEIIDYGKVTYSKLRKGLESM